MLGAKPLHLGRQLFVRCQQPDLQERAFLQEAGDLGGLVRFDVR